MTRPAAASWPAEFEEMIRRQCRLLEPGEPIDPDTSLALLGIDSVQILMLIVEIEETFLVEIPETMLTGEYFATPRSIWSVLESLGVEAEDGEAA
ncbi:acyl carrier protein [Dactylosporangium sp. NPDC051485]|uniref:acyl carrier protein n=1 Tax=Dactylosporangium sp. NPDC051485 TaxID=3154846 RepID=UPI00343BE5F2